MGDREVDQQLVARAQRGDKRAYELLVGKYQRKLGRLLSRWVRDPEEVEDAEQLRDGSTPESELEGKQIAAVVNRAMDALPDDLRTAITLREIEGLSYDEIASVMNCPIGTVRSRIFRAREAIATELRPLLGTEENRRW